MCIINTNWNKKLVYFHPHKTTVLYAFHDSNREAVLWSHTFRPCMEKWTPHPLCSQTKLGFNSVVPWNPQSNRFWSAENLMLVGELPVQSDKFGVCGVLWVRWATFFWHHKFTPRYTHSDTGFFITYPNTRELMPFSAGRGETKDMGEINTGPLLLHMYWELKKKKLIFFFTFVEIVQCLIPRNWVM